MHQYWFNFDAFFNYIIDYKKHNIVFDRFQEATNGTGPDIIIEMLANVNLATDLKIINKGGIIVVGRM